MNNIQKLYNGVYKITFGTPEPLTAMTFKQFETQSEEINRLSDKVFPFDPDKVTFKENQAGCVVQLPLNDEEDIYGFGLQLKGFKQTGRKKHIRPNADPLSDSGDSHAPMPYYTSTRGYAVFVDTARYASFYCGQSKGRGTGRKNGNPYQIQTTEEELYAARAKTAESKMLIEIPTAKGVDIYIFVGGNMLEAVQKYNLFSGGGAALPEWALGVWYRHFSRSTTEDWIAMAKKFKEQDLPCTVFGLEPGWQSAAYSCSFAWDETRAAQYKEYLALAREMGFRVNLWEHAFVHPTSPIYEALLPHSGDYDVWDGLTPDFATKEAREIFGAHHKKIAAEGISGFKLDECDGSDFTGGWSFPNSTQFPSGLDGEQMHSLFGMLYQQVIHSVYEYPTAHLVRNSHALAAPYPFVLYSDLYEHKDFIRGVVNMGFSGILWMPEVRHAASVKDFIRRTQTALLSPIMQMDAWYIPNPPWEQINRAKNNAGEKMENAEEITAMVRHLFKLRESFVPYLKEAFDKYKKTGIPPFRALVLDYTQDQETYTIDDQYLMGDKYLAAPLTAESDSRRFYIPAGCWKDFNTDEILVQGWHEREFRLDEIPLFYRAETE